MRCSRSHDRTPKAESKKYEYMYACRIMELFAAKFYVTT